MVLKVKLHILINHLLDGGLMDLASTVSQGYGKSSHESHNKYGEQEPSSQRQEPDRYSYGGSGTGDRAAENWSTSHPIAKIKMAGPAPAGERPRVWVK